MTEDEAKTKWCPHAIASHTDPRAIVEGAWLHHCIGSACMAWRWTNEIERRWDLPAARAPEGEGWLRVEAVGGVAHWARQHRAPDGFCGLAGSSQ